MKKETFYTAINCMDGRVQLPVISYLIEHFGINFVDSVTEAGPALYLAAKQDSGQAKSILRRTDISVNKHKSKGIAVVAHYDCAGNAADEQTQKGQLEQAVNFLASRYPNTEILGLWVDSNWIVTEICSAS